MKIGIVTSVSVGALACAAAICLAIGVGLLVAPAWGFVVGAVEAVAGAIAVGVLGMRAAKESRGE